MSDAEALQRKVSELEVQLATQANQHSLELQNLQTELDQLHRLVREFEQQSLKTETIDGTPADVFTRRAEWTIDNFSEKEQATAKGGSLWSPKFRAAGLDGLQLEFFPKGREKTTFPGFCSLFLWCPARTKVKYQLWVGSFQRAPEEDSYSDHIGHGHSDFCPLKPEIDVENDSLTVGVTFYEVSQIRRTPDTGREALRLYSTPLHAMVVREAEVVENRNVNKVIWNIENISERVKEFPRGASIWSKVFTACGIREILLEFYPNGSSNTTKDGFCAFYMRCPQGVQLMVTLHVGKVKKGPIKTKFEGCAGKGLPDFCLLQDQINQEQDTLEVGIVLQNEPSTTLILES